MANNIRYAEHLYCVLSPGWEHCKLGRWRGHYCDLWSRYSTLLGPDITTVVVFECQGSLVLEKMLFTYARKFHITGEVYDKEAFQLFLEFCNAMCSDFVRLPTSRSQEARAQARDDKKEKKQQEQSQQERALQDKKRVTEQTLLQFIADRCSRDDKAYVNAATFKNEYNTSKGSDMTQEQMTIALATYGVTFCNRRFLGRREKIYAGIRLLTPL